MSDDEHEQPADPGSPAPEGGGGQPPARSGRARRVRGALASRAAGWVVATALAGAVVALAVTAATLRSAPIAVRVPVGVVGPARINPGNVQLHIGPGGGQVLIAPGRAQVVIPPAGGRVFLVPGGPAVSRLLPIAVGPGAFSGQVSTVFGREVVGTVASVSSSGFTVKTGAGQPVTVSGQSSTRYRKAGRPASASAVTRGAKVAVLGSLNGSTISAIVVSVLAG